MEWHPITSSMLESVAYENGALHARYKGGRTYVHADVPEQKFRDLLQSPSKGEYFNRHIKPHHPASK